MRSSSLNDAAIFIWDFADSIQRLMNSGESFADIVAGNGAIIDKFVTRSERMALKKETKLSILREEKQLEAVRPCSFKPDIISNPLFSQVKPRYLTPLSRVPNVPEEQAVSFADQLRDHPKEGAYYGVEGVALTPFVESRLALAEEFHQRHRAEMFELRSTSNSQT